MTAGIWRAGLIVVLILGFGMPDPAMVEGASPPGAAENFAEGNRRYVENDFAGAVAAYEAVVTLGVTAPILEYNLGNAYLKTGQNGLAILHYRRALKLEPRFEAAQANLAYVRASAQDIVTETATEPDRLRWLGSLRLGPQMAAMGMFTVFTLVLGLAGLRLRVLRGRVWPGVLQGALGTLFLLLGAALLFEWSELEGKHEGVVVVSEVEVRSGPAETYTVSFRLHEGTEVEIIRKSSGWHEVKVSDRLQGWVPEDIVAEI